MSIILNLETTSTNCSVSLSKNGKCIAVKELNGENFTHSENLSLFIDAIIKENDLEYKNLNAIAISSGPGSYTGLRIGSSTAKGICYGLEIPLIAIDTLKIMAHQMMQNKPNFDLYCPMVDARRMEVYMGLFDSSLSEQITSAPMVLDEMSFAEKLKQNKILFFGSGAKKFSEIIKNENASFHFEYENSASHMCELAQEKFEEKHFADLAYFEPNYLKSFQATTPKKQLKI